MPYFKQYIYECFVFAWLREIYLINTAWTFPSALASLVSLFRGNSRRPSSQNDGCAGELTLTSLRDRALLLVGWTGALRRSELVALTTDDVEFIEGEGLNVYIRQSKADQEGTGLVKGLPYGSNKLTCPVTALRQWLQAAERQLGESLRGISSAASIVENPLGSRR